jgi:L-fuconolactonase
MTIVDAHHHVWDLSVRHQPWLDQPGLAPLRRNFLLPDLEPQAAAEGVTATVLIQTVAEPDETPEMLALAGASDLVAGVVGWADLEAPGVADAIGALRDLPDGDLLVGIRHPVLAEPDPGWLARPAVLRGLAGVAAAGLRYDVVVLPGQLPAAVTAAAATPQLTFVLDHLGNPEVDGGVDESWARAIRDFAALPNTVAKLSGFLGEPAPAAGAGTDTDSDTDTDTDTDGARTAHLRAHYEIVLAGFGPDRLMFGSDWPVSTMMVGYAGVHAAARSLTAGLSPAERAAVFGETARRTYRLGSTRPPR